MAVQKNNYPDWSFWLLVTLSIVSGGAFVYAWWFKTES